MGRHVFGGSASVTDSLLRFAHEVPTVHSSPVSGRTLRDLLPISHRPAVDVERGSKGVRTPGACIHRPERLAALVVIRLHRLHSVVPGTLGLQAFLGPPQQGAGEGSAALGSRGGPVFFISATVRWSSWNGNKGSKRALWRAGGFVQDPRSASASRSWRFGQRSRRPRYLHTTISVNICEGWGGRGALSATSAPVHSPRELSRRGARMTVTQSKHFVSMLRPCRLLMTASTVVV